VKNCNFISDVAADQIRGYAHIDATSTSSLGELVKTTCLTGIACNGEYYVVPLSMFFAVERKIDCATSYRDTRSIRVSLETMAIVPG